MTFQDFFVKYKIILKEQKTCIKLKELPTYRKVFLGIFAILFITLVISMIFLLFNTDKLRESTIKKCFYISFSSVIFLIIIFSIVDNKKNNLVLMSTEHYNDYYNDRMELIIKLLEKYRIDLNDVDTIDEIINEAKVQQKQYDYLSLINNPFKSLRAFISSILTYAIKEVLKNDVQIEIIYQIMLLIFYIVLIIFGIYFSGFIIKEVFYFEYKRYEELIYDLKQIKLFYSDKNKSKLKHGINIRKSKRLKKIHEIRIIISQ